MRFVSLHHHTTFSFLGDGFGTPAQHVERAAELGYSAMALTEHGNVSSHFQFEKAAITKGIKPIFGIEAYTGAVDENRQQFKYHLTILAGDSDGYKNLNRIVTQSYLDSYYYPTVSGRNLQEHSDGLLVLSGCSGSLLACSLLGGKGIPVPGGEERRPGEAWNDAEALISRFQDLFGDRYFLEVQPFYELERSCTMNPAYAKLSRMTGVPLVVTQDIHYPHPEDSEMQAILHAVRRGAHTVEDQMREWNYAVPMTFPESDKALGERLMKTGLSRSEAWEAIKNTAIIAGRCNVTLPKAKRLQYPISEDDLKPW